ncbi:DNA/RNA non-specific endonuclease [Embleya sp. NBC_00896]|uniref:DNA/RNA non-specific endonuclease n=1 Tax=Embleya sp. NBC_00896 TaxID=2975961 RepID=UPI0038651D37
MIHVIIKPYNLRAASIVWVTQRRAENLLPGYRNFNISSMKQCENRMADRLKPGKENTVYYRGEVLYTSDDKRDFAGLRMTAYTKNGLLFDVNVTQAKAKQGLCPTR